MQWFPWYPVDFKLDTYHLTLAHDGAYRRLIDEYMINRGALPDNDAALARIIGVGLPDWLAVSEVVRGFFTAVNGFLVHKRCEAEIRAQNNKFKRESERGKKAAFAKYSKIRLMRANGMHAPPTLTSTQIHSSLSEPAEAPQDGDRGRKKMVSGASNSLAQTMAVKGWVR